MLFFHALFDNLIGKPCTKAGVQLKHVHDYNLILHIVLQFLCKGIVQGLLFADHFYYTAPFQACMVVVPHITSALNG